MVGHTETTGYGFFAHDFVYYCPKSHESLRSPEFERGLIRERVKAGLAAAKKKGKKFGRPDALNENDKQMALAMFNGGATKIDIAKHFNVTRQTIYTILKE